MTATSTSLPLAAAPVDEKRLRSALATQSRPPRPNAISASITFFWRAVLKLKHVPLQLFDVTAFPIMITLMFTYLFGGALAGSVKEYVQFLIPGILVQTVSMISMYTAIGLNTDVTKGIFDRFRALPFWRPAVLVGALLGDSVRYTIAASVVIILGIILGFSPDGGLLGIVGALGVLLFFAFCLSWIWTTIGLLMNDPESVMMTTGIASFPLTFISNIFVDPETMPEVLQFLVKINPISHAVTVVRGMVHGNVTGSEIGTLILSCSILVAIFFPITMYLFRNKNAH